MPTIVSNMLYVQNYEQQQNVGPEQSTWYDHLSEVSRIQRYEPRKAVVCIYLYIHTVMNMTILQLVAVYNIQLHVSDLYVGHHQVVQRWPTYRAKTCSCILYIATNCNIVVFMTVCLYRYIYTLQLCIIGLTKRG